MISLSIASGLASAVEQGAVGFAIVDRDGMVIEKTGKLSGWLPEPGQNCFDAVLLFGMEQEFAKLASGKCNHIVIPAVHDASTSADGPITMLILWDKPNHHFTIATGIDFASRQIESLLGSERRARRVAEEQLEAVAAELRLAAFNAERLRLARELHDTLAQSVLALLMQIRLIKSVFDQPERASTELAKVEDAAKQALDHARRTIARIRDPEKIEYGPVEPVELQVRNFSERTGVRASIEISEEFGEVSRHSTEAISQIVAEALRNIESHAGAKTMKFSAKVAEGSSGRRLAIVIKDDGIGFDPSVSVPNHFGLVGMKELAAHAGGSCHIESTTGSGTRIEIMMPASESRGDAA